jgi:hypothetical protein
MNLLAYAKAIAAFIVGAAAPLLSAAVANHGTLTSTDLKTALVTAILSGGTVLGVKNKDAVSASGLVVTLKTDVDKFLAVITAGLPTLVEQAAQAAIAPPVAPPVVVAPAAPAVYAPVVAPPVAPPPTA